MATRQERLSEFSEDIPPLGEPAQLLCQDHCGAYARATLRQPWPLKAVDTWKQDTFVADGGWATFSGGEPNQNAAEACAESAERGEVDRKSVV